MHVKSTTGGGDDDVMSGNFFFILFFFVSVWVCLGCLTRHVNDGGWGAAGCGGPTQVGI